MFKFLGEIMKETLCKLHKKARSSDFKLGFSVMVTDDAIRQLSHTREDFKGAVIVDLRQESMLNEIAYVQLSCGCTVVISTYWLYVIKPQKLPLLDKSLIYEGYTTNSNYRNVDKRFKAVKILFEDDISYYVESLTVMDGGGFGKRYSVKKRWTLLKAMKEIEERCAGCPHKRDG